MKPKNRMANRGDYSGTKMNRIYFADNLTVLKDLEDASVDLIYIDPPFNTGKVQSRTQIKTVRSANGDRVGFQGKRYRTIPLGTISFSDIFDDYLAFLEPRLREAHRVLAPHGSLYFHVDYREVHYCKVLLDTIFGRDCFLNEIIWAYDYGGRPRRRWPPKHDNISKTPNGICSMKTKSSAFLTWLPDSSALRKPPVASCLRMFGGTRLCLPTARNAPGIQPRSPWAF